MISRAKKCSQAPDHTMHNHAEQATLEAMAVRETVFALGDDDLVMLADALLRGVAQAARRARMATARPAASGQHSLKPLAG